MNAYDVAVIGGSVAGLQAALTLARARRRVVLVDDRRPRNRTAEHVHNYLGIEDPSPGELLAIGRRQLEEYGVEPALFAIGAAGHASTVAVALHADLLEQEL